MWIKMLIAVVVLLVLFIGYVSTREGKFRYERSGVIHASSEKIFPYLAQFKLGKEWSPYEKVDPNMKRVYGGLEGQVGSTLDFDGNSKAGTGRLEVLNVVPNQSVQVHLNMIKPFKGENNIEYRLTPEADGTRFTWTMSGDGGFMSKLMGIFIDCEKMLGGQMAEGIDSLRQVIETKESGASLQKPMKISEKPEITEFPSTHYVYVEKIGPFMTTARAAWGEATAQMKAIGDQVKILGTMALYRMNPEMIYRAGMIVDKKPANLPAGLQYVEFKGGKYSKFTVTGSYMNLPVASGKVFEMVKSQNIQKRDDYYIEHYVNNPATTPENDLITEILIPTK